MFKYHDSALDTGGLSFTIRRALNGRSAMHRGELAVRAGVDEATLLHVLEGLIAGGEVERLRPCGYQKDDRDFFRLTWLNKIAVRTHQYAAMFTSDEENHMRLAGEAVACRAD
jgi:hypothetical protein